MMTTTRTAAVLTVLLAGVPLAAAAQWYPATTMSYDALGRLRTVNDGAGTTRFQYDSLGRKTQMVDPDMGTWSYEYDAAGNLTKQTDAKNQTIVMAYDALDRITLKDMPPLGPDVWDVTYFYDGNQPIGCYSCYDPATNTTGVCNTVTATCVGVAGEIGSVCTLGSSQGCSNPVCDEACGSGPCTGATQACNASGTGWEACAGGTCPPPPPPPSGCTPNATRGCSNTVCDEACGSGVCTGATQQCNASGTAWGPCTGGICPPPPPPPLCTPNTTQSCSNTVCDEACGSGVCTGATQQCNASGTAWGPCTGGICPPPPATCTPNTTRSCSNIACEDSCDSGVCTAGTQRCTTSGSGWGPCTGGRCIVCTGGRCPR